MLRGTQSTDLLPIVPRWHDAVARKRDENSDKTPQEWLLSEDFIASLHATSTDRTNLLALDVVRRSGKLTDRELEITEGYTAVQLLGRLAEKHFSALEVTTAFCKRAAMAQMLLSCLTEVDYARALERARALDDHLNTTGKVVGPLHGLPISVKDSFCIKGLQSTVGWVSFLGHAPATTNSALVDILLGLGAVLYVKTNIPQTMMTGDSENNIFGRTLNPRNTSLTAGGSSGGEASLIAFRGSILGVGTDISGSIRIPAACCGLYGFKPSTGRIPFGGQVSGAIEGLPGPIPSAGPLAHNLEDAEHLMRCIIDAHPEDYDSTAHAVPWQRMEAMPTRGHRLRIGVLPEESVFPLHPPVRRAIRRAIKALTEAGHEIITLPEDPSCSVSLGNRLAFQYFILGPDLSGEHFGPDGEPPVSSVAQGSNPLFSGPFPVPMEIGPLEKIDALHTVQHEFSENWRKRWIQHHLDVLLAPASQNTAVPHDTYGWPPYTQIWNTLDYPACVIPYGKASQQDDPLPDPRDNFGPQPSYQSDAVNGAPCSLQVITRRFEDEKCLWVAKMIDEVLRAGVATGKEQEFDQK